MRLMVEALNSVARAITRRRQCVAASIFCRVVRRTNITTISGG